MHEWALAEAVLAAAKQTAEKEKLKEITALTIRIGELQNVERGILRFALNQLKIDILIFKNTKFHIYKAKSSLKCKVCGTTWLFKKENLAKEASEAIHFIPEVAHTYIKCPKCGSPDFEIISGRGIWLENVRGVK